MKKVFSKIVNWVKLHKVATLVSCVVAVMLIAGAVLLIMWQKEDPLNREEWVENFGKRFGYAACEAKESSYSDVKNKDEIFVYVHALKEEGIFDWEGKLEKRRAVTFGEMLSHTAKAFGHTYIDNHGAVQEQTEKGYREYIRAVVEGSEKYTDEQVLEDEEALEWLETAYNAYENRSFENKIEYSMKTDVKMMDTVTNYEFIINHEDREVLLVYTDEEILAGDVIVLGINENYPQGAPFKVDQVLDKTDSYALIVSEAELEDVFDSFTLEFNKELGDISFAPAEGVEVVASEEDKGSVEDADDLMLSMSSDLLDGVSVIPTFSYSKEGEFFNRKFTWSGERNGEKRLTLDPDYPPVLGTSLDGGEKELGVYSAGSFIGSDNKLHSKYAAGLEVDLGLALSDFSISGTAEYIPLTNVQLDVTTKLTVNPYFAVRGNASKSIYLGGFPIPLGYGFSVNADIYLTVSVEGEITVSPVISASGNVKKSANSKNLQTSGSAQADFELAVDGAVGISIGPDINIAWASIPLADAYAYVGVGANAAYSTKDGNEMTVAFYMPTLVVGTGEKENSILYQIIGRREKDIIHMTSDALFKCPYIKQYKVPVIRSSAKELEWSVKDNVLTISGDGWMQDYWGETGIIRPWDEYADTIEKIVINDNVNYIGAYAFTFMPNLTEVIINSDVEKIQIGAFESCEKLTKIVLPDSLTELGANAFAYCTSLEELVIPSKVKRIEDDLCSDCTSLRKVVLPAGAYWIGDRAFFGCEQLEDITLPTGQYSIGRYTFDGCTKLPAILRNSY